jgi:glycosyltransferase involved in cell wall biosynthesis
VKTPHIIVDAHPLVMDHFSGVGHYTLGILQGFDELAGEGKISYSLITQPNRVNRLDKYGFQHHKSVIANPISNKFIHRSIHRKIPFDLILGQGHYYFPSFIAWPTWFAPSTVVVHDVTYLAVPESVSQNNREYLSKIMPYSMKNAKRILTLSEFSKSEISKYYPHDADRIVVAQPAVDRRHFYKRSLEEIHKVKAKYDIFSEHYILSVGNVEPRKNYVRLIEAYLQLPKYVTNKYPLVIVGAGGWNNDQEQQLIQRAKEDGYRIINPKQFVEDKDMPALYSGAQFFVFVSVYEGFGMPPLEAYACGTPVLASNVASVPEAAGNAAVYVNPFNVEEIRAKLYEMIERTEGDRAQFDVGIQEHLTSLSWRKSAEITVAALTGLPVYYFHKENNSA